MLSPSTLAQDSALSGVEVLSDNLKRVHQRIHQACQRCGRDPSSVSLVCVTKGIPVETIREVVALGVTDIGENRVQEARIKYSQLSTLHSQLRWHLVGHLQRNKAKLAVALFEVIHSVDSMELAQELERQAAKRGQGAGDGGQGLSEIPSPRAPRPSPPLPIEVFIQVNVSGEAAKFGCASAEAPTLARAVTQLPHLRLRGLMTLAPFGEDPEQARPYFRRLRELRDELNSQLATPNSQLKLSMGMSQDFEVAIEEGADLVRIGTAIFGDRGQGTWAR